MMVIRTHFQATVIRSSPIQERENTLNLSAHALPPSYRSLMTTDDSRILDFHVDGGRLIASTLVQERSHLSNGSMDDHNRGSGQMMDGTQINIDVTALGL
ncbi:unnamed protein product [Lactuca saligna]|uniref:Uncharacterized protein n=1 Tax=Lactuca saligna TaxID=75948 RepID=A0AA35YKM0_LACSI|nr:unnamed protein product [Lactuca saligna]